MIGFKEKIYFLIVLVSLITASNYTSHPNLAPLAENSAQPSVVMEENSSVPTTELPPPILISPDPVPAPVRTETANVSRGGEVSRLSNEQIIWNFLRQFFNEKATAGIMGNMEWESSYSTADTRGGLGLLHWIGSRRAELIAEHPNDYLNLEVQLAYLMKELNKPSYIGTYEKLKKVTTVNEACIIFQNDIERPGIPKQADRIRCANEIYQKYSGK